MSKKQKAATDTVNVQLGTLTLDNAKLQKDIETLLEENKNLKKQIVELASVIENDLKADLKVKILAISDFKEAELEPLKAEQLQGILETLSKSKAGDTATSYKPIRTAGDSSDKGRTTVGNLFNKTRKEILEMGGEF